jgi:curli biogenesis system outer membrane secretion channel CsgG
MKRVSILLGLLIFFSLPSVDSQTISLAVIQLDPLGVDSTTAKMFEDVLQTEFSKIPIFQLVERSKLDSLLQEQELQLSGITNAQSVSKAGNILNVQKVVFGSIARYDSDYVKYLL